MNSQDEIDAGFDSIRPYHLLWWGFVFSIPPFLNVGFVHAPLGSSAEQYATICAFISLLSYSIWAGVKLAFILPVPKP